MFWYGRCPFVNTLCLLFLTLFLSLSFFLLSVNQLYVNHASRMSTHYTTCTSLVIACAQYTILITFVQQQVPTGVQYMYMYWLSHECTSTRNIAKGTFVGT